MTLTYQIRSRLDREVLLPLRSATLSSWFPEAAAGRCCRLLPACTAAGLPGGGELGGAGWLVGVSSGLLPGESELWVGLWVGLGCLPILVLQCKGVTAVRHT